jgi:hypothetical protein
VDDLELSEVPFDQEISIDTPPPVITALLSGAALPPESSAGAHPSRGCSVRPGRRSSTSE